MPQGDVLRQYLELPGLFIWVLRTVRKVIQSSVDACLARGEGNRLTLLLTERFSVAE